ncbi:MAG: hypothetical protein KY476_13665 [Planctomycetes bacterium]|nr:hypothetical protein [Planctomycetota bacterium]
MRLSLCCNRWRRFLCGLSPETLYSEDLNAGQVYDGVTVVNPFAGLSP